MVVRPPIFGILKLSNGSMSCKRPQIRLKNAYHLAATSWPFPNQLRLTKSPSSKRHRLQNTYTSPMNSSYLVTAEPILLLPTKFYPPHASSHLLQRPHLIEQLNQGLTGKLTLVAAPAGYGKSTIVTQWLNQLQGHTASSHTAWLSLDESDNDLILFLHYFVAAIQHSQPHSCATTLAILYDPKPPHWSQLITLLVNDLIKLPNPQILVLDDYHYVEDETIHQFMERLLAHLPLSLHLVIISRTEPPLSLPRLRVRRQLNELRTADLSFSDAETEHYLTQDNTKSFTPAAIAALQERSQGWVASLYLATLSLGANNDEETILKQLEAGNSYIMDYLVTEVLAQQPQAVQTFLLYTSILRRFCSPLCVALLETSADDDNPHHQTSIPTIIGMLAHHHLFTIPLDSSGTWYRYHHLFQLMLSRRLQNQLSATRINALHCKASRWFAQAGFIDEALYHALIADDVPFAIQLVEQNRIRLLNQYDYHTINRWLSLLPETAVNQSPHLLLLKCWVNISTYRVTAVSVPRQIQQVETLLQNSNLTTTQQTNIQAEILAAKLAHLCWIYDFSQIIDHYHQAITRLPQSYHFIRAYITFSMGIALQTQGKPHEAIHIIQTELHNETQHTLPGIWLKGLLAVIHFMAGYPHAVIQIAQDTLKLLENYPTHKAYIASPVHRWLGTVYYHWNQIATAQHHFRQATPFNAPPYHNSQLFLAWSYETTGQPDKADQVITDLHHWAASRDSDIIQNDLASFEARRLCWQGQVDRALAAMREVNIPATVDNFMMEVPALTHARILIAHHQETSWQKAQTLLERLWASAAEQGQNIPGQIEILALKALLQQRQGFGPAVLATLEQAINIAKPIGFIRIFVDLGTPMAALLYQLLDQGFEPDFLGQILAAFPQTAPHIAQARRAEEASQTQLIEPLTRREIDVLQLLAQDLPNKKIAQELSVSPLTVKRHTINIYKKLSVSSRHEAANTARTLGIL